MVFLTAADILTVSTFAFAAFSAAILSAAALEAASAAIFSAAALLAASAADFSRCALSSGEVHPRKTPVLILVPAPIKVSHKLKSFNTTPPEDAKNCPRSTVNDLVHVTLSSTFNLPGEYRKPQISSPVAPIKELETKL